MRFESMLSVVLASTGCSGGVREDLLRIVGDGGKQPVQTAKLIEAGHDVPTGASGVAALVRNASTADEGPFDGLVVDIGFNRQVFTRAPLARGGFDPVVTALHDLPLRRVTENFQSLDLDPGDVDWFDDISFAQVVTNAGLAATMVRDAGLRGVFFDTQPYVKPIWSYPDQPAGKTFAAYQVEVSQRGREVGGALFDAYPAMVLMLNLAYSELFRSVCLAGNALDQEPYGLLPFFLDGLLEEANQRGSRNQIVDGFIGSYPTLDATDFELFYHLIHFDWGAILASWKPDTISHRYPARIVAWSAVPHRTCDDPTWAELARNLPSGFGIMMDYDADQRGGFAVDAAGISRNYFSPGDLTRVTNAALVRADRYVWMWNESVDWWGASALPPVPDVYVEALRRAHTAAIP